jgi:hypothetical protein
MKILSISGDKYDWMAFSHAELVVDKVTVSSDTKTVVVDVEYLDKQTWVWYYMGLFLKDQYLLDVYLKDQLGPDMEFIKYTFSAFWYNRGTKKMCISFRKWDEEDEKDPSKEVVI